MAQQGGINAPYTRFRGPVLVGQSSDFGTAAINGTSTAPLISFWNASEFGFYVTSTAQVNFAGGGIKLGGYSTDFVQFGTTQTLTTALSASVSYLVIPKTTGILSSGLIPASLNGGVALVWAESSANGSLGKLWAYTTDSTGWMSSTTAFWSSTST